MYTGEKVLFIKSTLKLHKKHEAFCQFGRKVYICMSIHILLS